MFVWMNSSISFAILILRKVVTKGVELTPVLDPALLKHYNISLNIDWSGTMSLSGFFKVSSSI